MTLKNSFLADGQEKKKTENKKYGNTFFTDAWENMKRRKNGYSGLFRY